MRRISLLLFVFFISFVMKAQVIEVSGTQDGIWDCDTVKVVGDVVVPADNSLKIMSGTKVIFNDFYNICVEGAFEAIGSEDDSIYFTVRDTLGFYIWDKGKGGWNGLTLRNIKTPVTIDYCHFSFGKAADEDRCGGALRIHNVKDITVSNCTFYHNFTREKGGALYAEKSYIKVERCDVDGNLGYNEDASYMHGGGFQFLRCNVDMTDMYFHDNYCTSCYGGGINFDSCNVVLNKAIFEDNYAVNAGGLGIQRCNGLDVRIYNVLLNNNVVYHYGGAMAIAASSPLIENVTMANNYTIGAGGGAMQFYSEAQPIFKNCIIWGNDWYEEYYQDDASQIFIWGTDCAPSFYNSVLQGGLKDVYGSDYVKCYEEMIEEDPLFIDLLNRDYRLKENSPAINAGTIDTTGLLLPDTDLAGLPRVLDNRIDMGCFEFSGISVPEISHKNKSIKISPNPVSSNSICEINIPYPSNVTIKIYNQIGMIIASRDYGLLQSGSNIIPLNGLIEQLPNKNELYLLSIESQYNTWNTKFIY